MRWPSGSSIHISVNPQGSRGGGGHAAQVRRMPRCWLDRRRSRPWLSVSSTSGRRRATSQPSTRACYGPKIDVQNPRAQRLPRSSTLLRRRGSSYTFQLTISSRQFGAVLRRRRPRACNRPVMIHRSIRSSLLAFAAALKRLVARSPADRGAKRRRCSRSNSPSKRPVDGTPRSWCSPSAASSPAALASLRSCSAPQSRADRSYPISYIATEMCDARTDSHRLVCSQPAYIQPLPRTWPSIRRP